MKKYILVLVALLSTVSTWADVDKTTLNKQSYLVGMDAGNQTAYFSVPKTGSGNSYSSLAFTADTVQIPETIEWVDPNDENNKIVYKIIGVRNLNFKPNLNKIVILPDNATSLAPTASNHTTSYPGYVTGVSSIILSKNIQTITNYVDCYWSVKRFEVAEGSNYYKADDEGVLYNADKTTLVYAPYGNKSEFVRYTIPSTVTKIGDSAFRNFDYLERITVEGNNLKEIGSYAFRGCINLLEFISSNTALETIGDYAFYSVNTSGSIYKKLGVFTFTNSIKSIGEKAFCNANFDNSEFTLPGNLEKIGNYAFDNAFKSNLIKLIIPASLEEKLTSDASKTGSYVFGSNNYSTRVIKVYSYIKSPQNINSSFFPSNSYYWPDVIYIPTGTRSTYIAKSGWSTWASRYQESIDLIPDNEKTATPDITWNSADSTITITTATVGATIYYTTDGTEPTTASEQYTTKIPGKKNMVVNAIAYKDGLVTTSNSLTIDRYKVDVTISTYAKGKNLFIKLTPSESGVTIKYTKNGSNPNDPNNTKAKTYTEPFSVNDEPDESGDLVTSTVYVYASKDGFEPSEYTPFDTYSSGSGYYVSNDNVRCAAPVASFSTTEDGTRLLKWTSDTPNAVIYYTYGPMNSTPADPDTTKTTTFKYTKEIELVANYVYKAIAFSSDKLESNVTSQKVKFFTTPTPELSYKAYYDAEGKLTTKAVVKGSGKEQETLWYRKNRAGDIFAQYTDEVPVASGDYIEVSAKYPDWNDSQNNPDGYFYSNTITCQNPQFAIDADNHKVIISTPTEDATIYYTLYSRDGVTAKSDKKVYTEPITLNANYRVKAYAAKSYMINSSTSEKEITNWFTCPIVKMEQVLVGGAPMMKLSLADSTTVDYTDMKIYYKVNNYWWNQNDWINNGDVYSEPVYANNGNTIYAVAIKDDYNMSPDWTAKTMDYSSFQQCAAPKITLNSEDRTIEITTTEPNGKIYYTIDGTTPTTKSTLYTTPFTTELTCTVRAITARDSETVDDVTTDYANSSIVEQNLDDWFRLEKVKFIPVLGKEEGTYLMALQAEEGTTIEYGINNETGGTIYDTEKKDSFIVNSGDIVYAIARKDGRVDSYWNSYTINDGSYTVSLPTVSGADSENHMFTVRTATDGAVIYYSIGDTDPTSSSTKLEGDKLTTERNGKYKFIAIKDGMYSSPVYTYNVNWHKVPDVQIALITENNVLKVKLTCEDSDAQIYYGINSFNSDYVDANTPYKEPFAIPNDRYVYASAVKEGYNNANRTQLGWIYWSNYTSSTPDIVVGADTLVNIVGAAGTTLYYTLDGTDPTPSSSKFTEKFKISENCTIKAIAVEDNKLYSSARNYTYSGFTCANVVPEQIYENGQIRMKLTCATPGAIIRYGVGSRDYYTPENNLEYVEPVEASNGTYVYYIAMKENFNNSSWGSKVMDYSGYTQCAKPVIEIDNDTKTISMSTSEPNGKIYYTLDGSTPTTADSLYKTPFTSEVNCIVKAITARDTMTVDGTLVTYVNSFVAVNNLDDWFRLEKVKFIPILGKEEGTYLMALKAEEGASIEYGINTQGGTVYDTEKSDSFAVNNGDVVYAIARKDGRVDASWARYNISDATYTVNSPNITANSGTHELVINSSTDGATIYYTTDNSTPTTASKKLESDTLTVTRNDQYKFVAIRDGMYNSSVSSYNVSWFKVPNVVITPFAENNVLKVQLSCEDADATIHYGINDFNSDNVAANAVYKAPIEIENGWRIYACAIKDGYTNADRTYSGYIYTSNFTCTTPTITVAADTMVTISGDDHSTFYYTLDDSEPTSESTKYTDKFKLTQNTTIKAIAIASDRLSSSIQSRTYSNFKCADVVASQIIDGGLPKMKLTCATPGVTIRYGVGGYDSYTLENNEIYTEPVELANGTRIYYIASKENFNNSKWGNKAMSYSGFTQCAQPVIEIDNQAKTISMSTTEENGKIYYTLDGRTPTTSDSLYKSPFTSKVNCVVKAVTARDTMTVDGKLITYVNSYATEKNLDDWFRLQNVKFYPVVGAAEGSYKLVMEAEKGATIEYGINNYGGEFYTDTIDVSVGSYVYAIARKDGVPESQWSSYYISKNNYTVRTPSIIANAETHVLTVTTDTEGADIYYTKGSSTPTAKSTKLTGNEISISRNDTLNFIAIKKDMYDSPVYTYNVRWFQVPNVTITPFAEDNKMKVSLSCEDTDADIYYGIGEFNTDNVRANAVYEGPFEVQSGNYVYASAYKDGFTNANRTSTYLNASDYTCSVPTITIAADTTVTISAGEGESLYYTLDGSSPTTSSTKFTSKFKLEKNATIKAIAAANGKLNSSVYSRSYSGFRVNPVTIIPFVEDNKLKVRMETSTPDANIYYALNNWNSTLTSNIPYEGPFVISEANNGAYIYANAVKDGFNEAGISTQEWLYLSNYTASTPNVTLESDTTVILTADANASIYYTLDGSTPTTSSTLYTSKFKLNRNVSLRAMAVESEKINSAIREYDYNNFRVAYPTFKLNGTTLTISSETPDAVIYYAFGDDAVADENANKYTGPFTLPDNRVVKAIAMREGWNNSNSRTYTPDNVVQCPKPIMANDGFDGHSMQLSTIDNATIYYTTDGTVPTREIIDSRWDSGLGRYIYTYSYSGIEYTEPIQINQICTVIAKAYHPYMVESDTTRIAVDAYTSETSATTKAAGGLEASMKWSSPETIKEFSITGPVNSVDIKYIRDNMTSLEKLDLSSANLEGGIIPDSAFVDSPLLSFSSPNNVKTVGSKIFSGCKELASVEWNSETKIPQDAFDNDVNPNLLLFVIGRNDAPSNIRNVIVNETASNIYLSDSENNNFYCPKQFYAENIIYTHEFVHESGDGSGWETLALPFDCSKIVHDTNGELLPFASYNELKDKGDYKPFWLRELTDIGFQDVKQIEANKPYLICMPNNKDYATRYRLGGTVNFSASNVRVPATDPKSLTKGVKTMTANFLNNSETDSYYLLNTEATDDYKPGSVFVKTSGRALRPFEAYVTSQAVAAARFISILGGDENETSTDLAPYINSANSEGDIVRVYNISGILVKQSSKEDALKGLAKGVYIVNGKRMIVK